MAQSTQKVICRLVDVQGKTGTTSFRIPTNTGSDPSAAVTAYALVLDAITNCKILDGIGQTATNDPDGGANTNAYNCRDKLRVQYRGTQGDVHIMSIPDPDPNIFDPANFKDVDTSSTGWTDLKSAIESNVLDRDGNAVTVVRGYRQMSRRLRSSRRFV